MGDAAGDAAAERRTAIDAARDRARAPAVVAGWLASPAVVAAAADADPSALYAALLDTER